MNNKNIFFAIALSHLVLFSLAQSTSYDIRLNQVGFLPNSKKQASFISAQPDSFKIVTTDLDSIVYQGESLASAYYASSEENVCIADFTLLNTPGDYVLVINDIGKSVPFSIKDDVFYNLSKASIKAFYYNRASIPILSNYAGVYARELGHPDTAVVVLPSAASVNRPAGTIISTPKGWYDAGDYNKYIVNSGISTFTLLSAYETYPEYYDTLNLNIPESDNQIPDILDEALWNIKWMMSMQDSSDGGVYHKTTEAYFSSFVMPSEVTDTRYVTAKSTAATLDFAAIMAMTARIYKKFDPELADQALQQSLKAWQWAKNNPNVVFTNPSSSGAYPSISTGEYGDSNFDDEFSWCAAELYITIKDTAYYSELDLNTTYDLPGWGNVKTLGLLSLIIHKDSLTVEADPALAKNILIDLADNAKNAIVTSPYRIPGDYYYWGGTNAYANWGMLFMQTFRITHNATYYNAALSSLDYLLGRNATTYCFVTGAGTRNPMNIHHRISGSDGIADPIPGLLVGGPNPGNLTDCGASQYPSSFPALAYADLQCSYSTNEVAINWNAPLAFLSGAIQSEYLNNFTNVMPVYFSVSTKKINLPANAGFEYKLVIEGNTEWTLSPTVEWINLSSENGTGSAIIQVSSKTDNTTESEREGKIYVYSQEELADSVEVIQNGKRRSFRLEAEDYLDMMGLQTESASDEGGGLNLGYVDIGDWVTYNIDISYDGVYDATFRHAGYAGNFDISVDDTFLQTVTFNATSDWQVWESYTTQINFTEGEHILKFDFNSAGTNLNWMDFNWVSEVGIDQKQNDSQVLVFPIPAHQYLYIALGLQYDQMDIQLISLDGKLLLHKNYQGTSNEVIDIHDIEKGVYILKLNMNKNVYTRKVIIQ